MGLCIKQGIFNVCFVERVGDMLEIRAPMAGMIHRVNRLVMDVFLDMFRWIFRFRWKAFSNCTFTLDVRFAPE